MAFLKGWDLKFECKLCGYGCTYRTQQNLSVKYYHGHNVIFTNGYPDICSNAGKLLTDDEVNKIRTPIYEHTGFYGFD